MQSKDYEIWMVEWEGPEEVKRIVVSNMKNVFSSEWPPIVSEDIDDILREIHFPHLPNSYCTSLMQPISSQEVRATMFAMPEDKSSGPDGVLVDFLRKKGI